ncbi:MAG: ubiquinol-cytochrome c reductase iron-sulfur subunit [Acidobacteriota bacterium]|nr:ubiquinol-cytochrome c reductase iron-sulfur subunit [Acidobacteriota bacterium]
MENKSSRNPSDKSRRAFLLILPFAGIAGVFTSIAAAAIRFLRPMTATSKQPWIDLVQVAEITGNKPLARKVRAEQVAGWAKSVSEHSVYVLPSHNNQVVSAICPHEGCEVSWHDEEHVFACPCHDSNFTADGQRINGPARRGLDPLPSRVVDGKLQVQYQFSVNYTSERIPRG